MEITEILELLERNRGNAILAGIVEKAILLIRKSPVVHVQDYQGKMGQERQSLINLYKHRHASYVKRNATSAPEGLLETICSLTTQNCNCDIIRLIVIDVPDTSMIV
jgi:hypothetical protein